MLGVAIGRKPRSSHLQGIDESERLSQGASTTGLGTHPAYLLLDAAPVGFLALECDPESGAYKQNKVHKTRALKVFCRVLQEASNVFRLP